jgi:two-component system CitB family sensor kinase
VNQTTARRDGRDLGTVVTLRDRTEASSSVSAWISVRGFAEALRASNHEASNRLHTVVTLIELDRPGEAVRFATGELAAQQELVDRLLAAVEEPVLAALVLGKVAQARERGIDLGVGAMTAVHELPLPVTDAVTLVGNLIDNAVEAVAGENGRGGKQVRVDLVEDAEGLHVQVADSGPGIAPELREDMFVRGFTTKAEAGRGLGLALVAQIVMRHNGTITVAEADGGGALFDVRIPRRAER